jgi:hypothetical protein
VVDSTGNVGSYTSTAIDSNGYWYITYYDATNEVMKMAKSTDSGTTWSIVTVDSSGIATSLKINQYNWPCIAYYHLANQDLKYAYWNGSIWVIQTVDSSGDVGNYPSLALDSYGFPHISYYDASGTGNLKYVYWNGTDWIIQTIDSSGVGMDSSITIDSADRPHISYYDANNGGALKYAGWTGSNWIFERVDEPGVGQYTSIAVVGDEVRISYYDYTNGDLKFAIKRKKKVDK